MSKIIINGWKFEQIIRNGVPTLTRRVKQPQPIRNLGRALSIIIEHQRRENAMHDDVDAFHAPSECHDLVSRHEGKRFRAVRRHVEGITGHRFAVVMREAARRTSAATMHRLGL